MDTTVLRWFQQVADGTSVTDVSALERVSQSGVSRALARLEDEVGTPLLRRSGRSLRMTRAGAAFKHHVDVVLHALDDGLAAVDQVLDPETGTVTLSFQPSLGSWLVPELLATFQVGHPQVRFDLRPLRDEVVGAVRADGDVDLELTTVRPAAGALRWQRLLRQPLHLAVGRDHALAGRRSVAFSEAAALPFVVLPATSELRGRFDDLCAAAGFRPVVAHECGDLPTVRGFVAAGLGVAVVPVAVAGTAVPAEAGVRTVAISDPAATREIGLAWSPQRRLLPAAERFRTHVLDRARG
ncbi:LysR family transcriptional regulator [Kineococcus sp. R8]|uniref:LysR substrate-binding domain-containing protein n=1 Tax=Kineococcus siccus TaxID=2696567 RepID=UPI00141377C1|nr:LysR family transcriptional regulator [Kineococcus siccus]